MNTQTENRLDKVTITFEHDSDPDTSYLDQPEEQTRKQMYFDGLFYFGGITAMANVDHIRKYPDTGGYQYIGTSKYFSSGSWGIESDSDDNYFLETAAEQMVELRRTLHEQGYTDEQIRSACDPEALEALEVALDWTS